MGKVHRLISELSSNLVHSVQTTNHKHLEVKLRSDTQEHVHVQVIVVGDERLGSCATSNGVQHGCLDGNEVAVVEPTAHVAIDLGAGGEDVAGLVVHHQVEVSLAEALLGVLETIVIVGDLSREENVS